MDKKKCIRKWFGKKQVITSVLVLILAGAIYINWRYSDLSSLYEKATSSASTKTGRAEYVATQNVTVDTAYFDNARADRETEYEDAIAELETIEKSAKAGEEEKSKAYQKHIEYVDRHEKQTNAESLIKAKGFDECLVIMGDKEVNVVIGKEDLADSEVLQIQDVIQSVSDYDLSNIKIIQIK